MDRLVEAHQFYLSRIHRQLLLGLLACLSNIQPSAAEPFPYVAYVRVENTYVRSGPGQRYYPTSQLPQGFAVEVYRHEADGWCAIRPPEGSFSWIGSHQVRQVEARVVEIVDDNVVTRVGSVLSPNRSAVQVLLPKGERVELLTVGEEDDPRWVRVAPPSGEFRWIATSNISRQPPMEVEPRVERAVDSGNSGWSRQAPVAQSTDQTGVPNSRLDLSPTANASGLQFGTPALPDQQLLSATSPAEPLTAVDPNAMEIVAGSPAELQLAQFQAQQLQSPQTSPAPGNSGAVALATPLAPTPAESALPRVRFRGLSSATTTTDGSIETLELRLSQTVVLPPAQWELEPLKSTAKSLLASTKAPALKAQLRDFLTRIDRFQAIKTGYTNPGPTIVPERDPFEATTDIVSRDDGPARDVTGLSSDVRDRVQEDLNGKARAASRTRPSSPVASSAVTKPLYDATGMLKPVVSQRHKAPQYALVDEQGKVVSFVTPTPELDLKPYLGRRIGVHGQRGYMPEYRRAHVTAGRVTPIDETIRR